MRGSEIRTPSGGGRVADVAPPREVLEAGHGPTRARPAVRQRLDRAEAVAEAAPATRNVVRRRWPATPTRTVATPLWAAITFRRPRAHRAPAADRRVGSSYTSLIPRRPVAFRRLPSQAGVSGLEDGKSVGVRRPWRRRREVIADGVPTPSPRPRTGIATFFHFREAQLTESGLTCALSASGARTAGPENERDRCLPASRADVPSGRMPGAMAIAQCRFPGHGG
ncbi:hypothetical protein GCM10010276_05530 [Streptomyces longisporus]|uniref:Uncharacterized protein n=1 Tax=Streptomyces longisporus TaxID=1948 RepID=A0ABN3L132_STRLO